MKEKKLATMICCVCGKEIDKSYGGIKTVGNYCKKCAFDRGLKIQIDKDFENGEFDEDIISDATEAVKKNQNAGCYVEDLLSIIHRLQSENKKLKTELQKECQEHLAFAELAKKADKQQKAEIERLTEENEHLDMVAKQAFADYQKCEIENAELQKQVDELTVEKAELEAKANDTIEFWMHEYDNAINDTAKEILTELIEKAHSNGCIDLTVNEVKAWFREDYGVEVE